jgi:hypothetical protein
MTPPRRMKGVGAFFFLEEKHARFRVLSGFGTVLPGEHSGVPVFPMSSLRLEFRLHQPGRRKW